METSINHLEMLVRLLEAGCCMRLNLFWHMLLLQIVQTLGTSTLQQAWPSSLQQVEMYKCVPQAEELLSRCTFVDDYGNRRLCLL